MEDELRGLIRTNGWDQLYAEIRRDSAQHDFTTLEASREQNRPLNRYRDVYPYDHSRVKLLDHPQTDYINASLVKAPLANRSYILAQGPLSSTVGHFWLTVWQQRSKAVLMLNRVMEKGALKCHQYWPIEQGGDLLFEDVSLLLENIHSEPGDHYTVRTLRLSHTETGESREILHFHYTTWPDFGVPACPDTFLLFLQAVRDSGSLDPEQAGPPVVHCSAGIGRSGTFCLVDTCLVLIAKEGAGSVSARKVLLELRNYRMGLIQTPDQLKFSYRAIATGAAEQGYISDTIVTDLLAEDKASSASDSDDDAPPPLPPPRSESLKVQQMLQNMIAAQNNINAQQEDPAGSLFPDRLSAAGLSNGNGADHSGTSSSSDPSPDADGLSRPASSSTSNSSAAAAATQANSKTDSPSKCILNNHKMEERKRAPAPEEDDGPSAKRNREAAARRKS